MIVGVVRDNTRQTPIAQKPSKTMAADPSGRYPRAPVREPRGAGASVSPEDTPVKISGRGNSGKGRGVTPDRCAHGERGDETLNKYISI